MPDTADTGNNGAGEERVSLGFGDLYASPGDHIGHFYQTTEEWKEILIPFLGNAMQAGEKCIYFMEPGSRWEDLREGLADAGGDVEGAIASGQLVLDEGRGNPEGMQEMLAKALAEIPGNYPFLRWGGDMTWSLEKVPTSESLMEWESHCNVIESPRAVFLCQYDLKAFRGDVIMDALKTHPTCVISSIIHQNPYYEDPESFLEELRARESTSLA